MLLLVGNGCRKYNSLLQKFIKKHKPIIVTTFLAKDLCPTSIGCIGIKGNPEANDTLYSSPKVLVLGASLNIAQIGWNAERFNDRDITVVNIEEPNKLVRCTWINQNLKIFLNS
jgi:thiamine pyrophosphate-dependent acetolactate synthase large subunit-like protein